MMMATLFLEPRLLAVPQCVQEQDALLLMASNCLLGLELGSSNVWLPSQRFPLSQLFLLPQVLGAGVGVRIEG